MNVLHLLFLFLAVVVASQLLAEFNEMLPFLQVALPYSSLEILELQQIFAYYPDTYEGTSVQ